MGSQKSLARVTDQAGCTTPRGAFVGKIYQEEGRRKLKKYNYQNTRFLLLSLFIKKRNLFCHNVEPRNKRNVIDWFYGVRSIVPEFWIVPSSYLLGTIQYSPQSGGPWFLILFFFYRVLIYGVLSSSMEYSVDVTVTVKKHRVINYERNKEKSCQSSPKIELAIWREQTQPPVSSELGS